MIVPMIKYSFLLYHGDQEKFLHTLGEIGVVDITVGEYSPSEEELSYVAQIANIKSVIDTLNNYGVGREITNSTPSTLSAGDMLNSFTSLNTEREALKGTIAKLDKEISAAVHWGAFSVSDVNRLNTIGVKMHYFSCAAKDYNSALESEHCLSLIHKDGTTAYFVGFSTEGEELDLSALNCTELRALDKDITSLSAEMREANERMLAIEGELDSLFLANETLTKDLESISTSLRQLRITQGNRREAEDKLIILEGWCPKDKVANLESGIAATEGVITLSDKAIPEDNPPIKLKNSKLFSPAEMITRLFSLPNYSEVDITPFFAPFFIFFVGMCIGDAIYGLLFFIGALVAYIKNKSFRPVSALVMWCSAAAILMGAVTGMYGGIEIKETMLLTSDDMFPFAIGVGLLQILYAMLLQAYFRMKRFGFLYGLSNFGWALTLITVILANVMPMMGSDAFSSESPLFLPLIIVGLVLTIFFQNPKANPFSNLGAGLWFIYNGITGLLSDTLSYIRLFALGLSGGIIAGVFNTLAVELSPDVPVLKYVVIILILAIGHGINIFMSAISAFVHPLRLTFVEFYKNVGFEGGGRAYDPFIKNKK